MSHHDAPEPRPVQVWPLKTLAAYLALGIVLILAVKFGLDQMAAAMSADWMSERSGRRSMTFVVAAVIGLLLTRWIAPKLGLSARAVADPERAVDRPADTSHP